MSQFLSQAKQQRETNLLLTDWSIVNKKHSTNTVVNYPVVNPKSSCHESGSILEDALKTL